MLTLEKNKSVTIEEVIDIVDKISLNQDYLYAQIKTPSGLEINYLTFKGLIEYNWGVFELDDVDHYINPTKVTFKKDEIQTITQNTDEGYLFLISLKDGTVIYLFTDVEY